MRHDTTNGRTDRRTYLKALGAGALAIGMGGIAGCLGVEAGDIVGGGSDLDLSPFTTYTNTVYGYQIERPANWTVDDSSPEEVEIDNSDFDVLRIMVSDGQYGSDTLEEITNTYFTDIRESTTKFEVSDRRGTTLESSHSAIFSDATYDLTADEYDSLRQYLLVAKQGETVYEVHFIADTTDWTPAVERDARRLVESLTIGE